MRGASPRSGSSLLSFGATVLILHVPRFACWGNARDVLSAGRVCGVGSSSVRRRQRQWQCTSRDICCARFALPAVSVAQASAVCAAPVQMVECIALVLAVSGDGACTLPLSLSSVSGGAGDVEASPLGTAVVSSRNVAASVLVTAVARSRGVAAFLSL